MLKGGYPYFVEEAVAAHDLDKGPEHDDGGDSHADVGSPGAYAQLFAKHEERTDETAGGNGIGDGMSVAEEYRVD